MSMKVAYQVKVFNGAAWVVDTNWKNISIDRSVFWDSPAAAQIELDNHRGATRTLYAVARQVKIYRNTALIFYGIITKPKYWVDAEGQHAAVELLDFYRWKLKSKITGITEQWNLSSALPSDLVKAMIGTRFIHQDPFDNTHRIDTMSDVAVADGKLSLVKDASGYKPTGYALSTVLQNGDDDVMGDISAAYVYVYPAVEYENMAPNPDFEEPMPGISTTADWTSNGWDGKDISSGHRTITQSTAEKHGGTYSIHMVNDNSTPDTVPIIGMHNKEFACEAGQTWIASVWHKGGGEGWIRIIWAVGDTVYNEYVTITPGADWAQTTVTKALPANVRYLWMDLTGSVGETSDIYFDDVFFGRVPNANNVDVSISRDGGGVFTDAAMTYDTTDNRWEGSVGSVDYYGPNIVTNGGFETGNYNGWTKDVGTGVVEVIAGAKYSGTYGLHIAADTTTSTGVNQRLAAGTAKEGDVFNISAAAKKISGTGGNVYVHAINAAGASVGVIGSLGFTGTSWGSKNLVCSPCPANTSKLTILVITQSITEVYFDDIILKQKGVSSFNDSAHKKSHVITGTADGAQTNYQVKLILHSGSGSDSGSDVYLGGHAVDFPNTLKFTNNAGSLLDFFIESYDANTATVWVEVDSIPANPGTATIWVHYGNLTTAGTSSGDNTFLFYDDFTGTTANTSKWTVTGAGYVISGGKIVFTNAHFTGKTNLGAYTALKVYAKCPESSGSDAWFGYWNGSNQGARNIFNYNYNTKAVNTNASGSHTNDYGAAIIDYHTWEIIRGASSNKYVKDGTTNYTDSTNYSTTDMPIDLYQPSTATNSLELTYVTVRKYTDNEPTHGSWGTETQYDDLAHYNQLVYKITLTRESATSAPIIDSIEIQATTASDTGVTEGTIDDYTPPAGYAATMDKDFGDTTRDDAIASIYKVTGMEPTIDIDDGTLSLKTVPAKVSSGTLTLGTDLTALSCEEDLLPCGNAIAYTGSGTISENTSFTHRVYLTDDTSIAAIGRIEKCMKGKDLPTTGMVNNRAYNALQILKSPPRTITGTLTDSRTTAINVGNWYTINDPTSASGISSEVLRVMSESRRYDISGESCDLALSTIGYNRDPEAQFNSMVKSMEVYRDTVQAANGDDTVSISGNCKNSVPLKLTFYIKDDREVQNIELSANSEKYKDCQATDIVEFGYFAPCQIYINGDYDISPKLPCPDFGVQGNKDNPFDVKRLNLTNYYSNDYTNKLKSGYNTVYFVPSTVSADNTNGLLYINAFIKVCYSS